MAFYDTDFCFGLCTPQAHDGDLASARTASRRLTLEFSSRRKPRLWPLFQYVKLQTAYTLETTLFFSTCTSGIILNVLSVATACQCGHKLHKTLTPSQINVLICIPCTWHAAVERNYYIPSWHRKLAGVSRRIFLSLSLLPPEIKKIRLARETNIDQCLLKIDQCLANIDWCLAKVDGLPILVEINQCLVKINRCLVKVVGLINITTVFIRILRKL